MDQLNLLLIIIVLLAVAGAAVWTVLFGPGSLHARRLKKKAKEMEIRARMSSGADLVEHLRQLGRLHMQARDLYEADKHLQRALKVSKHELGTVNPALLPLLSDYLQLLKRMRRKREARQVEERIAAIKERMSRRLS